MDSDAVEPAPPLLASNLFAIESEHEERAKELPRLQTGRRDVDMEVGHMWHTDTNIDGAGIVGIAGVREGMAEEVAKALVLSHINLQFQSQSATSPPQDERSSSSPPPPTTYLITLPNTLTLSPVALASHLPSSPSSPLDSILWLRYLDLVGLIECVNEVSSSISSTASTSSSATPLRILIVIQQPDATISSQDNLSTTAALTSQLLRSLNHLSVSHDPLVQIITTTAQTGYLPRDEHAAPISAFATQKAGTDVVGLTRLGRRNVLGRMLEGGVGRWILVHERERDDGSGGVVRIVEAVKGRMGETLGWGVWE